MNLLEYADLPPQELNPDFSSYDSVAISGYAHDILTSGTYLFAYGCSWVSARGPYLGRRFDDSEMYYL